MKILLTLFVLLFSSSVVAEDISDFEIEGISVGDSLLDYFNEEEILTNQKDWYHDEKYKASALNLQNISSEYDMIGIHYKKNDKKFIIEEVDGVIFYDHNIEDCYLKKDKIFQQIKYLFKDADWKNDQYEDADGIFTSTFAILSSGDTIGIQCYDWNNRVEINNNFIDHLRIIISSAEFDYWLNNIESALVK